MPTFHFVIGRCKKGTTQGSGTLSPMGTARPHTSRTKCPFVRFRSGMRKRKMIERPIPKGLLTNEAFAQVLVATGDRTIYTSGQVSIDAHGELVGAGDLAAQTVQAMKNLGAALAAAGATLEDVVKTTTYVVRYQPEHRAIIGEAKKPFWSGQPSHERPNWRQRSRLD
jgi:enamine deaminase RidA (YjgF/YER057c/UK114 family)